MRFKAFYLLFYFLATLTLVSGSVFKITQKSFEDNSGTSEVLSETTNNSPTPTTASSCTAPSSGCGQNYYWDSDSCQCKPQAGTCVPPFNGCPTGTTFNTSTCECVQSTSCTQPSEGCGQNYYWNSATCACTPNPTPITSCTAPASGCPSGYSWSSNECRCIYTSGSGGGGSGSSNTLTPTASTQTTSSCVPPSSGCGTNRYWDTYTCNCRDYQTTETNSCQPPGSGCSANYYWDQNSCACRPNETTSLCSQPSAGCATGWYWEQGSCSCRSTSDSSSYYSAFTSYETQSSYDRLAYEPPERIVCVKSKLTDDEFNKLRYLVPADSDQQNQIRTIGEKVKTCWGSYPTSTDTRAVNYSTYTSPMQAEACLINSLGQSVYREIHEGKRTPTYDEHLKFERCYGKVNDDSVSYLTSKQSIPAVTDKCLKNALGGLYPKVKKGDISVPSELQSKVDACFGVDPQPFRQAVTIKIPEEVKSCLTEKIGETRIKEIESAKSVPSESEKANAAGCFAKLNQIQTKFIPAPPEQIHFLDTDEESVKLSQAVQEKTTVGPKELGGKITLSGKSLPDSVVTIYIFSEPIVVTTKTDENGDWVYELNQPLSGEKHLAYAAVKNSSGKIVKSGVLDFTVVAAEEELVNRFIDEEIAYKPVQNNFLAYALIIVSSSLFVAVLMYIFYFNRKVKSLAPGNGEGKA